MRRGYIDWLRGLAVVIMIEAHTIDAWTRPADRELPWFGWAIILGGFGAPLFLFLAGIAVALSASAKVAKGSDVAAASAAVQRRGWEIFGLAFLFRLQSYVLNPWSSLRSLFKVDILNIMGPSIVAAAALWRAADAHGSRAADTDGSRATDTHGSRGSDTRRLLGFAIATFTVAITTPVVRELRALDPLPAPLEGYLRPQPGLTNFTLFPWAGFVFAGAFVGVLIARTRDRASEARLIRRLAAGGAALALAGYGASYLPSIYARSSFWTSSPTFFFLRTGLLVLALAAAYLWERGPAGRMWSPMQQLGRTSLFIYWIHVEMVYGALSAPIRRQLPFGRAVVAFALFTVAMVGVSLAKTWVVARWRARRTEAPTDSVFRVFRG
jgi:uncharacterized membrane protein